MPRILVIEDELPLLEEMVERLQFEQFEVFGTSNGGEGVQIARQYLPDLIICDVMMPEMSGYEVLEALRHDPITATIPFIFLTAKADKPEQRKGMEAGADDYLTKPFTYAELIPAIRARLHRQTDLRAERLQSFFVLSLNVKQTKNAPRQR